MLERGSLMRAMRASMAIPGAVTPVEIDGRLLVDGGIANNLPIDVARKLCADVVIAVNIATPAAQARRDQVGPRASSGSWSTSSARPPSIGSSQASPNATC